ncbi:MAG: PspA/IM30 family protein [Anaerolineae bacterium]|nr:MAG: PspA/IM30 family protein [Anaerolineae bacterium]
MGRLINKLKKGLNALMAPAEDPRQTYTRTCERQRVLLARVQQSLVEIAAVKKRLEVKAVDVRSRMPQIEEQARQSLRDGREDMARLALQRHQMVATELKQLEGQMRDIEQEEHRLRLTEQRLSAQIEAFYTRLDLIAVRYNAAEAQVEINEALTGVSEELAELGRAMEQAERKSEYMQARAAAIERLVEDNIFELPFSAGEMTGFQMASLGNDQDIESKLLALKNELA